MTTERLFEEQRLEYDREKKEKWRRTLETQSKEHLENELLDLLTDPDETRIDILMRAQAMYTGLTMLTDPLARETRSEMRKARKLLRRAKGIK